MHPSVLSGPKSPGTAGAESLGIRIGNVFTPGEFMEPAEEATVCVFQHMGMNTCMYLPPCAQELMQQVENQNWTMTKGLQPASLQTLKSEDFFSYMLPKTLPTTTLLLL